MTKGDRQHVIETALRLGNLAVRADVVRMILTQWQKDVDEVWASGLKTGEDCAISSSVWI